MNYTVTRQDKGPAGKARAVFVCFPSSPENVLVRQKRTNPFGGAVFIIQTYKGWTIDIMKEIK